MTGSASGPTLMGAEPPRALYLHFPFCVHRCHYCDFSVKRSAAPPVAEWLELLDAELGWWFDRAGWARPIRLDTIFVGGGTPSLAGRDGPSGLAAVLAARFDLSDPGLEWTVEANPASLDEGVAAAWLEAGATRISIGVQALDDGALRWLGRLHDRRGAIDAIARARSAGFRSVSMDLLFGLPEDVPRDLAAEIETALAAGIDHASAYGLTIEPRTPLARRVELGHVRPPPGRRYEAEYRLVSDRLVSGGLAHYEVSSFARPGHECRHNWYYWNRSPYLGAGPSAHGFLPPFRIWNAFRWDRYRESVRSGSGPVEGWERLEAADDRLERLWLGLRTRKGVARADAPERIGRSLSVWTEAGWILEERGILKATVDGWLRLDALVAEIDAMSEGSPR